MERLPEWVYGVVYGAPWIFRNGTSHVLVDEVRVTFRGVPHDRKVAFWKEWDRLACQIHDDAAAALDGRVIVVDKGRYASWLDDFEFTWEPLELLVLFDAASGTFGARFRDRDMRVVGVSTVGDDIRVQAPGKEERGIPWLVVEPLRCAIVDVCSAPLKGCSDRTRLDSASHNRRWSCP